MKFKVFQSKTNIAFVTSECPTIPAFKEVLLYASHLVNMISKSFSSSYFNTYNAGWRNPLTFAGE